MDKYDNKESTYRGTVHFTSTDTAAKLPANYLFTSTDAGLHTFIATFNTVGTNQSITATDTKTGTITGSETGITVVAPPLSPSGLPASGHLGGIDLVAGPPPSLGVFYGPTPAAEPPIPAPAWAGGSDLLEPARVNAAFAQAAAEEATLADMAPAGFWALLSTLVWTFSMAEMTAASSDSCVRM